MHIYIQYLVTITFSFSASLLSARPAS